MALNCDETTIECFLNGLQKSQVRKLRSCLCIKKFQLSHLKNLEPQKTTKNIQNIKLPLCASMKSLMKYTYGSRAGIPHQRPHTKMNGSQLHTLLHIPIQCYPIIFCISKHILEVLSGNNTTLQWQWQSDLRK